MRIDHYRNLINDELNRISQVKFPQSFYEPVEYILAGGGKRIRPVLVCLCCKVVGGDMKDCLNAAVAIELLHNFTLVHDDIMDHDDLRRGRLTVHKKWDEATAILAGDGLVALAYLYLLKTESDANREIAEIFTQGIIRLCEGQALDKEFENQPNIEPEQYLGMIEKKTALLLIISAEIGAIIGGANRQERVALRNFANELGCAFQIQDDLLDIEATSRKTFASDIKQKKKTILYIQAVKNAAPPIRDQLIGIYQRSDIDTKDIAEVRNLFETTGAIAFARQQVKTRIEKAQKLLNIIKPSDARDDLHSLLNMILNRKS